MALMPSPAWEHFPLSTQQLSWNRALPLKSLEHFSQDSLQIVEAVNTDITGNEHFEELGNKISSGLEDSRSRSLLLAFSTILLIRYLAETIKTGDAVQIGGSVSLMGEFIGYTLEEIGSTKSKSNCDEQGKVVENLGKALATAGSIMGFGLDVTNIKNGFKCLREIENGDHTHKACNKNEAIGEIIISFFAIGLEIVELKCPRCVPWTITLELTSLLMNDILQAKFNSDSDKHVKLSGREYSEDLLDLVSFSLV